MRGNDQIKLSNKTRIHLTLELHLLHLPISKCFSSSFYSNSECDTSATAYRDIRPKQYNLHIWPLKNTDFSRNSYSNSFDYQVLVTSNQRLTQKCCYTSAPEFYHHGSKTSQHKITWILYRHFSQFLWISGKYLWVSNGWFREKKESESGNSKLLSPFIGANAARKKFVNRYVKLQPRK